MGGGAETGTQTTRKYMPPWQEKEFKYAVEQAGIRGRTPLEFYPSSTVAQRDAQSTIARDRTMALGGKEYRGAAEDFVTSTLRGDFMDESNPYLDRVARTIADRTSEQYKRVTLPSTMTRFAGAGRSYSDAADLATDQNERNLGRTLYEGEAQLRYGDYENRLRDRMAAVGLGAQLQGMDVNEINQLRSGGAIEEDYLQRLLGDDMARFQFEQTEPEARLDRLFQRVSNESLTGSTTTGIPTGGGNPGVSIGLGILSAAATVAGSFVGSPGLGMALGAGIQGLGAAVGGGGGGGGGSLWSANPYGDAVKNYLSYGNTNNYGYGSLYGGGR